MTAAAEREAEGYLPATLTVDRELRHLARERRTATVELRYLFDALAGYLPRRRVVAALVRLEADGVLQLLPRPSGEHYLTDAACGIADGRRGLLVLARLVEAR